MHVLFYKYGFFLENNNKTQTISLVRKRLKLIWNITTRVQRGRFPGFFNFIIPRNRVERTRLISLENESKGLGFKAWKPSPLHSVSKPGNRVRWTRFLLFETEFNELVFQALKPSPLDSISFYKLPASAPSLFWYTTKSKTHHSTNAFAEIKTPKKKIL